MPPLATLLALTVLAGPVLAGLGGAAASAFGWAPALGARTLSLDAWRALAAWPGLAASLRLTLTVALLATALSLGAAILIAAATHGSRRVGRALAPLMAAPHAAAAFGLAFLIAPSGWITRALSPWATGWTTPPDAPIPGDPWGLSIVAGLVLKETPFLLMMILAAAPQADAARATLAARTLGRGPAAAWLQAALPRIYPQIRLPMFAALAWSASAVDVAAILGPAAPPPLAVQITLWMRDPDLALRLPAAAAALLLAGLILALAALWRLGEATVARLGQCWLESGDRLRAEPFLRGAGLGLAASLALMGAAGFAALALWSVAGLWVFPDALPQELQGRAWAQAGRGLGPAARDTLLIGGAATLLALGLAIACLEAERRAAPVGAPESSRPRLLGPLLPLLCLPLIVPDAAFLSGLQFLALALGVDGGRIAVIGVHLVFVAPYVLLALAEPWRALDPRFALTAAALGARPARAFRAVVLPMLLRPVLNAAALGFAVSASLYLPTLLVGGGRVSTLATEAVALAAGGDRRAIGVTALVLAALPFVAFATALAAPALLWRNRRGLR